ncbi:MAG TPA: hypothetical protein VGX50_05115 [Longimicrobium sp.]|jgi:hypothetical protein|nr:hypothetical protein [Longimicrobium sp.]
MPRQTTPEQLAAYVRLRDFTLALAEVLDEVIRATPTSRVGRMMPDGTLHEYDVPNDGFPGLHAALAEGLGAQERRSMKQAQAEVRMMLQDLLEASRDFGRDLVMHVDARFATTGLPTLSQMRQEVWKTIPKVIARGRIRTEEEYSLLIERLNDVSGEDGLSAEEREQISRMVGEFEARVVDRTRRGPGNSPEKASG